MSKLQVKTMMTSALFVCSAGCITLPMHAVTGQTINLSPGDDIQAAVSAAPSGTTFVLAEGLYRGQMITPKDNDIFTGQGTVVLNGSQVLTFSSSPGAGGFYTAPAVASSASVGQCDDAHPLCGYAQDLFIDGALQIPVASTQGLSAGYWYFDRVNNIVSIPVNPSGHTIELAMQKNAFTGTAQGVQISYIVVEKYATLAHSGAIGGMTHVAGWTCNHVESRFNHGTGIELGPGSQILNSYVHHNGQMGLSIVFGDKSKVVGNEISWNNTAGFLATWEAGGTKFWSTTNLLVQSNYVHDNIGKGLWTDTDNVGTIYNQNTVVNNLGVGIQHEVSYNAVISSNIIKGNASQPNPWLGSAQIRIYGSSNVEIHDNTIEVAATGGNAIALINVSRGSGTMGLFTTANNYVHNNTITYLGSGGFSGFEDDSGGTSTLGNRFDYDKFMLVGGGTTHWDWHGGKDWSAFQAQGEEVHGVVN